MSSSISSKLLATFTKVKGNIMIITSSKEKLNQYKFQKKKKLIAVPSTCKHGLPLQVASLLSWGEERWSAKTNRTKGRVWSLWNCQIVPTSVVSLFVLVCLWEGNFSRSHEIPTCTWGSQNEMSLWLPTLFTLMLGGAREVFWRLNLRWQDFTEIILRNTSSSRHETKGTGKNPPSLWVKEMIGILGTGKTRTRKIKCILIIIQPGCWH